MRLIGRRGPRLAAFVDEWWALYAEPNLERATLRIYRWVWEQHARPHLGGAPARRHAAHDRPLPRGARGGRRGRRDDPQDADDARQRLLCAVEWQLVDRNPSERHESRGRPHARRAGHRRAGAVEAMRRTCGARPRRATRPFSSSSPTRACGRARRSRSNGATSASARWSSSRRSPTGSVKELKNRRRPRAVRLLEPLRDDLEPARDVRAGDRAQRRRLLARDRLAQLAPRVFRPAAARAGLVGAQALRPPPRLRLPADRRGPAVDRRDRRAARPQPDRLPRHLRARDGGAGRRRQPRPPRSLIQRRARRAVRTCAKRRSMAERENRSRDSATVPAEVHRSSRGRRAGPDRASTDALGADAQRPRPRLCGQAAVGARASVRERIRRSEALLTGASAAELLRDEQATEPLMLVVDASALAELMLEPARGGSRLHPGPSIGVSICHASHELELERPRARCGQRDSSPSDDATRHAPPRADSRHPRSDDRVAVRTTSSARGIWQLADGERRGSTTPGLRRDSPSRPSTPRSGPRTLTSARRAGVDIVRI